MGLFSDQLASLGTGKGTELTVGVIHIRDEGPVEKMTFV